MKEYIEQRVTMIAQYIIDTGSTVRETAKKFKVSKSTVHKDMVDRLPSINRSLYKDVKKVLDVNKAERHLRGGQATLMKYKNGYKKQKKLKV